MQIESAQHDYSSISRLIGRTNRVPPLGCAWWLAAVVAHRSRPTGPPLSHIARLPRHAFHASWPSRPRQFQFWRRSEAGRSPKKIGSRGLPMKGIAMRRGRTMSEIQLKCSGLLDPSRSRPFHRNRSLAMIRKLHDQTEEYSSARRCSQAA